MVQERFFRRIHFNHHFQNLGKSGNLSKLSIKNEYQVIFMLLRLRCFLSYFSHHFDQLFCLDQIRRLYDVKPSEISAPKP
ncbi:MAG: hypothetical protein CVT99_14310 [Bacteroidetes bacterium HGW-Bacteroidetes-16]|nr:MAG: hypothetical protein CVT99_14310 [Bacteroidetes bacterium HGW-Bacteroidetes-16]